MANIIKKALKSTASTLLRFSGEVPFYDIDSYQSFNFQRFSSDYSFGSKSIRELFVTGYMENPTVFGIMTKIQLSSLNIKLVPYRNGKPIQSKSVNINSQKALINLLMTGTCIFYKYENIGFGYEYDVIDTVNISEEYYNGTFRYFETRGNERRELPYEDLTFVTIYDNPFLNTNLGISPLQVANMTLSTIREMYLADGYLLQNKGADILISSGSDEGMLRVDQDDFDKGLNDRIKGARRTGRAITTTKNVNVTQLGRTVKELALWDGHKIKARDIATALQVSTSILNDPDNKQYSNAIEGRKSLYEECTIPFMKIIFNDPKVKSMLGFDVWVDTSEIDCLQQAQKERNEKNKLITDEIILLNEKVNSGSITRDIAVMILVSEWVFDEEEAQKYIQQPNTQEDENNE